MGDEEGGGEKFENSLKQRQHRRGTKGHHAKWWDHGHVYLAVLAAIATRPSLYPTLPPRSYRLFF